MKATFATMRGRPLMVLFALSGGCALFACVDLFHSTDFPTICEADPNACPSDTGADTTVEPTNDAETIEEAGTALIDFCQWSPTEALLRAERSCAWISACVGMIPESKVGTCMLHALGAYDCRYNPTLRPNGEAAKTWSCLAETKTCDDVKTCLYGSPKLEARCPPVTVGAFTSCANASVVQCGISDDASADEGGTFSPVAIHACALEGRTCNDIDPSLAICAGKAGADDCSGAARCDGTHAIQCRSITDIGFDCASFGAGRCEPVEGGVACAPIADAGACSANAEATATCDDGGVARSCVGGKEVTIDCKSLGMPCSSPDSPLDPTQACANRDASAACPDTCADGVVTSCDRGKSFKVDCRKYGLTTCQKTANVATCVR